MQALRTGAPPIVQRSKFFRSGADSDSDSSSDSDSDADDLQQVGLGAPPAVLRGNPFAALASSEGDDDEDEDEQSFDEITSDDFRKNHVLDAGEVGISLSRRETFHRQVRGLIEAGRAAAQRRGKPKNTMVLLDGKATSALIREVERKTARGTYAEKYRRYHSNIHVTDAPYFFVVFEKLPNGQYTIHQLGRAKLRYGVQSVPLGRGSYAYEITHLSGVVRPVENIRL